ncbi:serine/threonine-protein kinase [Streptomyces sp. Rer75]|uniref:serine/threonine-protein kinase n=1 Tax=Streptomyces sp. Rer75 TaxID=2750011 RepID=UPI0015D05C79|nr:serine/threonine-protein kinase [Streptomyces sp. Rer75]QLH23624.1 serine/threonine protein kinase [Streptomyces sp. Rer75]
MRSAGAGRLIAERYLLLDRLGRGGMGTVWRARDHVLEREVAVKELHVSSDGDEHHRRLRRAVREARTVARVHHPHVVGVHDLVEYDDRLWITMELIDGPSLDRHLAAVGPLSPPRTAALGLQLLSALEAVHAVGALHRDIKPANILLRPDGSAVLTDFGIAALEGDDSLTTAGELLGSIGYMAPERLTADEVGPPSDLWALGATLSAVASGVAPFHRTTQAAALHAVTFAEPNIPDRVGPLRPIVEALLHKSPDQRPSAAAVRDALRHVADGAEPEPLTPSAGARTAETHAATVRVPQTVADVSQSDTATMTGMRSPVTAPTLVGVGPEPTVVDHAAAPPPRRRRVRWWWPVAAGAASALITGLFLALTDAPPSGADDGPSDARATPATSATPTTTTTTTMLSVQSAQGWQRATQTELRRGDTVTVRYSTGTWTVDSTRLPGVGSLGHSAADDESLRFAWDCKVDATAPFGTLLGRFSGNPKSLPSHRVKREWRFRAAREGTLELRINDGDTCMDDNKGALTVSVLVTR